jgi:hypothetical protein
MKDLEELGRLKDLGLLTDEEFETARQEIFSQRPNATDPADDGDADPEEPEGSVEEGEVASPSELDIVSVDDETTTDSTDNWWQASDGQWYPPEALDALKEQGWFQGDDGQWYPPPQTVAEEPVVASLDPSTEASSEQAPASVEPAAEASAITHDQTGGTPEPDDPDAPSRVRRVSAEDLARTRSGRPSSPHVPVPPAGRSSETSAAWRGSSQNATSTRSFSNRRLAVAGGLFVAVAVIVMVVALSGSSGPSYEVCSELADEIVQNGSDAMEYQAEAMEALMNFDADASLDLTAKGERAMERAQRADDEFVALGCEGYAD